MSWFQPRWRYILRKAWSVRLALVAGMLSGLEVIVPFFSKAMPTKVFAALSFVVAVTAVIARIVAQPGFEDHE